MYENKEHFIIVYREGRKITYGDYYGFHRHTTTNRYALIGQWVVRDGGEFIDVREPIRTLVKDRQVQVKVQVLGINKDGSLNTSHFEVGFIQMFIRMFKTIFFQRVGRGVVDSSGLNENQLVSRFVVVEFTYLHPKFHHRNAEWRVILILEQESTFDVKGVVYAKEEEVYRIHSKEFPLDFKVAKTRNSFNRNLELGTSIQFDFPSDGINVDQYRVLYNQNVSVFNKKVVVQDTYHLNHKTKLMYLDQSYFVFDLSYNLQAYMERLGFRKVNAFFELAQHDSDRVMYVLSRYQPFMEIDSDGFNRDAEKRVGDNGNSAYSNNNNIKCYGSNSGDTGGDRGRKEAEVVAKMEKCKELIRTAENLISALSSVTIAERLSREAERIRKALKYLPRDYGTLHHQMSYKELEQEERRLNESIEHYEEAIKQAVLFLIEQDLVDQRGTAAQVIGCFLADNL
ncbi:hypothetical protein CAEBREN_11455 [Caenorhabditis brenneri]|uniref:Uncharacterized protein n=1 Tax=Caenorhabditis brenneri TaxID=135651 RepID=G0MBH6_CAEBE|nr:hypothetical protein CAEBREN_11455 [Caenorhabditis brenneri]